MSVLIMNFNIDDVMVNGTLYFSPEGPSITLHNVVATMNIGVCMPTNDPGVFVEEPIALNLTRLCHENPAIFKYNPKAFAAPSTGVVAHGLGLKATTPTIFEVLFNFTGCSSVDGAYGTACLFVEYLCEKTGIPFTFNGFQPVLFVGTMDVGFNVDIWKLNENTPNATLPIDDKNGGRFPAVQICWPRPPVPGIPQRQRGKKGKEELIVGIIPSTGLVVLTGIRTLEQMRVYMEILWKLCQKYQMQIEVHPNDHKGEQMQSRKSDILKQVEKRWLKPLLPQLLGTIANYERIMPERTL